MPNKLETERAKRKATKGDREKGEWLDMTEQQLINFYNKIDNVDVGKRDMSAYELNAIRERNGGKDLEAAVDGFHLGFIKGQRAEQAKARRII